MRKPIVYVPIAGVLNAALAASEQSAGLLGTMYDGVLPATPLKQ